MNLLQKEGFKHIDIGKATNGNHPVTITTNISNKIEFEASDEEVNILKKLLEINDSNYADEGEIDDDISKVGDEIDSLYQVWAEYIDQIDDGSVEKEKIKILEMEIELFSRKIRLLKRQLEILKKEKQGTRARKIKKQLNEENIKQKTLMIFHELMLLRHNSQSQEKKKTQVQAPTMSN